MKTFNQWIENPSGDSHKITKSIYTVQPKNKEELKKIIKDTIKKEGNRCDLNFIDTSLITDMSELFAGPSEFNGNISKWNTSNVRDMSGMFSENYYFEGDLSDWDVSYGVCMDYMFKDSELEKNDSIPEWY